MFLSCFLLIFSRPGCLRLLLEQLAESGERLDLERVRVADDVFTEALACREDFLRSCDAGNELVLWDRYDDRQPTSGATPVAVPPAPALNPLPASGRIGVYAHVVVISRSARMPSLAHVSDFDEQIPCI